MKETNEREQAQLVRDAPRFERGTPWLLLAEVMEGVKTFTTAGTRKLVPFAEAADAIHVAAGKLEAEGYEETAARLRAILPPPAAASPQQGT